MPLKLIDEECGSVAGSASILMSFKAFIEKHQLTQSVLAFGDAAAVRNIRSAKDAFALMENYESFLCSFGCCI